MTNNSVEPDGFRQWIASRRDVQPPEHLSDQIMRRVREGQSLQREVAWLRLVHRIERSRLARCCVCSGALAVGGIPFLFLAYVAKFLSH